MFSVDFAGIQLHYANISESRRLRRKILKGRKNWLHNPRNVRWAVSSILMVSERFVIVFSQNMASEVFLITHFCNNKTLWFCLASNGNSFNDFATFATLRFFFKNAINFRRVCSWLTIRWHVMYNSGCQTYVDDCLIYKQYMVFSLYFWAGREGHKFKVSLIFVKLNLKKKDYSMNMSWLSGSKKTKFFLKVTLNDVGLKRYRTKRFQII